MGINLKIARIKKGMTQFEVAKSAHMSYNTYNKFEQGIGTDNIRLGQMKRISEVLGVSIKELFFSDEQEA